MEDFDEVAILEILDGQRRKIKELKQAKTKKYLPQQLWIWDDVADRPDILHSQKAGNVLSFLTTKSRHIGANLWLSTQKLTTISTVARVNFTFMCCWRQMNAKELEAILIELSAIYPLDILHEMYQTAVYDEDYSFWYINFTKKRKEDMFYVRLEHRMVLDE